jgi:hypothetical protein
MKTHSLLLFFLVINFSFVFGQSPGWQWAKSFGGSHNDGGLDVAADASANVYTIGYFRDTVDFDPGPGTFNLISNPSAYGSVFLCKLDSSGNFMWAKKWDKGYADASFSIDLDAQGDLFITGYYTGNVDFDPGAGTYFLNASNNMLYFVLKLSSSGNFIWVKSFGGVFNTPQCYSVLDAAGNIYCGGFFSQTRDFDPGPAIYNLTAAVSRDIFVLKLDASGNFLWVKQISGTLNNWVNDIALDASNNIYITGSFSGTTDFDPGPGTDSLTAGTAISSEDIFVAKLDASGNYAWAVKIGGINLDYSFSIAVDNAANVYTTGYYNAAPGDSVDFDPGPGTYYLYGNADAFISKLDSAGNFVFAKSIDSPMGFSFGRSIALDSHANIYYTGYFTDSADFDPGPATYMLYADSLYGTPLFVSKLDSSGNFIWAESKGGNTHFGVQQNSGLSVFCDASDNVYFTGKYEDPDISFGSVTIYNYTPDTLAFTDVFTAKISSVSTGLFNVMQSNGGIYVYPNPSSGTFIFQSPEKITSLEIYNVLGEKVFYRERPALFTASIDLSNQPDGIYFYALNNNEGLIKTGKILKE